MAWANKEWREYIPEHSSANLAMQKWHYEQPQREQTCATPSSLTDCPRVVWLKYKHHVPVTNPLTWGKAQRLLLGRNFENQIAQQYAAAGQLLWHWKDDVPGESVKFGMGNGLTRIEGTPDLLLKLDDEIPISDAKTSRGDSFGYVPLIAEEAFKDPFWHKYKIQVNSYYLLSHANKQWFIDRGLPLPTINHLFSFALDDGIVRREFFWHTTREDAAEVLFYTKRWNSAYASDTMPACTCDEKTAMFCSYADTFTTTKKGSVLGTACCNDNLIKEIA